MMEEAFLLRSSFICSSYPSLMTRIKRTDIIPMIMPNIVRIFLTLVFFPSVRMFLSASIGFIPAAFLAG